MGRSVTCNYQLQISISTQKEQVICGAMKKGEILNIGKSVAAAYNAELVKIAIWAQTKSGEKMMQKDYAIMDNTGTIDHYNVSDVVPFYCF